MNLNKHPEFVPGAPDNCHSLGVPPLARAHTTLALLLSRALSSSLARSPLSRLEATQMRITSIALSRCRSLAL
jgi:hypothetical protein